MGTELVDTEEVAGAADDNADSSGSTAPGKSPPPLPSHWVDLDTDAPLPVKGRWLKALRAVAEAFFFGEGGPPPTARLDWLCHEAADVSARIGARSRRVLRIALWCVTWLAPIWVFRPVPLRFLAWERRIQALERFERSLLGLTVLALKAWLCILYFEHPDAAREIGFDGRCMGVTPGLPGGDKP